VTAKNTSFLLQEAVVMHRQGAVGEAAARYAQVLASEPRNVDALYLLGVTLVQQGRFDEAVDRLRRAVKVAPAHAVAHNFLGLAYLQQGKADEALHAFDRAIQHQPQMLDAYMHRANLLMRSGRVPDAVATYDRALAVNPQFHEGWSNRGIALDALARRDEAIASYDRAIALKPDFAEAHANRANAFAASGQHAEAIASFDRALAAKPDFAEAWVNRGNALKALNRPADALESYDRALAVQPRLAAAHYSRALIVGLLGRYADARASFEQALKLGLFQDQPRERGRLHADHAAALNYVGRYAEALAEAEQARTLAPDDDYTLHTISFIELLHGRWREGWQHYARRVPLKVAEFETFTPPPYPMWQGGPIEDGILAIRCERGLGDRIQFACFAAELAARGYRVALWDDTNLAPLLRTVPGVEAVISTLDDLANRGPVHWVHMMNLPLVLGMMPDTLPQRVPYLAAEPDRVSAWAARPGEGFKVGIAWQGNPAYRQDAGRSIPLREFAPLADIPGIRLISLQKRPGSEQIAEVAFGERVETPLADSDISAESALDTAAVMMNLDLIVSSDTMVPHLAGALGRPVCVALRQVPDWRWLTSRDDSPFYPSMRLFRQSTDGHWADVFDRISQTVRAQACPTTVSPATS
jgi:tetratricopeptide (TPR) repeat protein